MKVAVWDTYVSRSDGTVMHFDILVEETQTDPRQIFAYGRDYLKAKPFKTGELNSKECVFCHIETPDESTRNAIAQHGFAIIEMENCG